MQVIVDTDYLELIRNDTEYKKESSEYSPFTGRRVPVVSLEDIKKLLSLPKEERQELLTQLNCKYSKRS